jgi:hypothetical protein
MNLSAMSRSSGCGAGKSIDRGTGIKENEKLRHGRLLL